MTSSSEEKAGEPPVGGQVVSLGEVPGDQGPVTAQGGYTAIIFVHGIGSQRRYEETSRLIDSLDQYQFNENAAGRPKGLLSAIEVRVEPLRFSSRGEHVGYIRTIFSRPPDKPDAPRSAVRFYENYWAPIMAEAKSPWDVLRWLFRQPFRPRQTAFSPWRERQRLRRASLVSIFEAGRVLPEGVEQRDCGQLLRLYNNFEGLQARRDYPLGKFSDFLRFIEKEDQNSKERLKRHLILARFWRRKYLLEEAQNFLVVITIALALVLFGVGAIAGSFEMMQALHSAFAAPLQYYELTFEVTWQSAAMLALSLAGLLGLGKALTDYLGDVEAWATYEETDVKNVARRKILDQSVELFTHVLSDDACDRVVIISHSLGTSIAQDTLLALTQRNLAEDSKDPMRARVRLDKIDQFVTMGSPIDKLEYFFESYTSQSHRYKRVVEALRGDIEAAPFSDGNIPRVHWINFWDAGDPISGPLQTPAGSTMYRQRVDNVEVASFDFPDPGASHAGYFTNKFVIEKLFEIIYRQSYSFWPEKRGQAGKPDEFKRLAPGPDAGLANRRFWFALAIATPWLVLFGVLALLFGFSAAWYFFTGAVLTTLITVSGYLASKRAGPRTPI
jgi:hypothetical protein